MTLEQIKNEVAKEHGFNNLLWNEKENQFINEVAKRYATACVKASQGWVSVEERLPEVDVPVITYPYSMMIIRHMKMDGDDKVWFFEALPVTHWKPLPEEPKT